MPVPTTRSCPFAWCGEAGTLWAVDDSYAGPWARYRHAPHGPLNCCGHARRITEGEYAALLPAYGLERDGKVVG